MTAHLSFTTVQINLLFYTGAGVLGSNFVTYRKTISSPYDCLSSHTLNRVSLAAQCTSTPSSIIVYPA